MSSNESSASTSSALEAIVVCLARMEDRLSSLQLSVDGSPSPIEMGSDERQDPAIVERAPPTDLHPPEEFVQFFPQMREDFFRRPLDEGERRQFL
ncbi:hypothetical protein [Parasitella parasitica]|uniref:Uncharacterized protein n=1 Tax=Parasitella parasitica TaxID=35722 RepID=A0A0B7MNJ5_9FUNG|nr:hypothetical protein [Parasitella parasitica]